MKKIKAYVSLLGAIEDKKIVAEAKLSPPYVSRIRKGLNIDSFSKNMKALIAGYKVRKYRKSAEHLKAGSDSLKAKSQGKDVADILGVSPLLTNIYWTYKEIDGRLTLENKKLKLEELLKEQEGSGSEAVPQMVLSSFWLYIEKQYKDSKPKKRGRKKGSKRVVKTLEQSPTTPSTKGLQSLEAADVVQETASSSHTASQVGTLDAPSKETAQGFENSASESTATSTEEVEKSTFKHAHLFLVHTRSGETLYVHGDSLLDAVSTLMNAGVEAVKFEEIGNLLVRA